MLHMNPPTPLAHDSNWHFPNRNYMINHPLTENLHSFHSNISKNGTNLFCCLNPKHINTKLRKYTTKYTSVQTWVSAAEGWSIFLRCICHPPPRSLALFSSWSMFLRHFFPEHPWGVYITIQVNDMEDYIPFSMKYYSHKLGKTYISPNKNAAYTRHTLDTWLGYW